MRLVTSGWGRGGSYRRGEGGGKRGSGERYGGFQVGQERFQSRVRRGVQGGFGRDPEGGPWKGCRRFQGVSGVVSEGLGQGMVRFRGVGRRSRTIKLVHLNPNSCTFAIMALIQKLLLPPSHSGLPPQPTHPAKRRLIIRHVSSVSPSWPAGVRQITHSSRRRRPVGS